MFANDAGLFRKANNISIQVDPDEKIIHLREKKTHSIGFNDYLIELCVKVYGI